MAKRNYFQISTAIDYPSGPPHCGHLYEKICADVLARWHRFNNKVHFSTGLDTHGSKIERVAEKAKKTPLEFVNEMGKYFLELCKDYNISYDDFIQTTEKRHEKVAQYILKQLYTKGDIYKGTYEGPYCIDCETYYTEKDLINGKCPIHKTLIEKIKEEGYFFRLSKYQGFLIDYITKNPNCIWPESKRKEILNRLNEPLKDINISRRNVKWGIPLPFDKNLTEFVWFEAINNYLTTICYPNKKFRNFWPAVHIIGKDIIWHHTCLWFSVLKSLELELPKIVVHGFIRSSTGEKMSKSLGNVVNPFELVKKYGADSVRYYLIRDIPFGEDGDFSEDALKNRVNGELVNELGNLVNRSLSLAEKFKGKISGKQEISFDTNKIDDYMNNFELHKALEEIFIFIKSINKYINDKEPWKLKDKELGNVLYNVLEGIRIISILISPFMPSTAEKINKQLGVKSGKLKDCKFKPFKGKVKKGKYLFNRV